MTVEKRFKDIRYFALTEEAQVLAKKIQKEFKGKIRTWPLTQDDFESADALVMVMATGIVVRKIACLIKDKLSDPAVIVIDQQGKFVIPLLSGHAGSANLLAGIISDFLQAQAVITTATDVCGLIAWDSWAAEHNIIISNPKDYKKLASSMLSGKIVSFASDTEIKITKGLQNIEAKIVTAASVTENISLWQEYQKTGDPQKDYVLLSVINTENLFKTGNTVLHLHPKLLWLGIGCRKNTDTEKLLQAAEVFLRQNSISFHSIAGLATISCKAKEKAILELARKWKLPLVIKSVEEISNVEKNFKGSDFVKQQVGVQAVAEPSACLAAGSEKVFVPKAVFEGITLALAKADKVLEI